ncbi:uncharacterized protein E0L32_010796 [Thyridium curvatum]|uniref:Cytochrome P450 n=1 Tax=Thyridium curvatum TaxID=1093900 RepID=A0A507AQY6_9PEZI|nr:uncharacterized protein E0L32_010796 [Thyridium curvatum]TPX07299.1 hypothetical protein E0L32_010796 [Thyridium curvatum]
MSYSLAEAILLLALSSSVAALIADIIYKLYFHPLAKYPGPPLARVSCLHATYHAWRGDLHLDMWRCHERYGDVVRYKPNSLLFNTAGSLRDIYGHSSNGKVLKSRMYAVAVHRAPSTVTMRGGKDHARRRRILGQGLSDQSLRRYEGRILRHIDQFCDIMYDKETIGEGQTVEKEPRDSWSPPLDMSKWTNYLTFDLMSDIVFDAKYNLLGAERFRYVVDCIDRSNLRMGVLIYLPELTMLRLDRYIFRDSIKARNRFVKFVTRVVAERLQKTSSADSLGNSDLFAHLADAKDPETRESFTTNELAAESTTLIVAGGDTTSTAISAVLFYLSRHPDAYRKVVKEVRSTFGSYDKVKMGAQLVSCRYLHACIDEALRMSPPAPACLWREVVAPAGLVVDGVHVPHGVDVGMSIYAIQHSERQYTNPFSYHPERWLEDDGAGSIEKARAAFNPFSIGARNCLGAGLARAETMLTLARLLWLGDFQVAAQKDLAPVGAGNPGAASGRHRDHEYQLFEHITAQKQGPWLQFRAREDLR